MVEVLGGDLLKDRYVSNVIIPNPQSSKFYLNLSIEADTLRLANFRILTYLTGTKSDHLFSGIQQGSFTVRLIGIYVKEHVQITINSSYA